MFQKHWSIHVCGSTNLMLLEQSTNLCFWIKQSMFQDQPIHVSGSKQSMFQDQPIHVSGLSNPCFRNIKQSMLLEQSIHHVFLPIRLCLFQWHEWNILQPQLLENIQLPHESSLWRLFQTRYWLCKRRFHCDVY